MTRDTAQRSIPKIDRFMPQVQGPEQAIERAVARHIVATLAIDTPHTWLGSNASVGAGRPDLLVVSYNPELLVLRSTDLLAPRLLAYLHKVPRASLPSIMRALRQPLAKIRLLVADLASSGVISGSDRSMSLTPVWRRILTDITTVEAKVHDWKAAARQAARNRMLAHRSFIALPTAAARRASRTPSSSRTG